MKKFFVTTAIDYINSRPHLGHALEKIQADVLARHHRALGEEVFFLTGTDEHGIKNAQTAKKQGISPQELASQNTPKFIELCKAFNISNDDFIKTTDQKKHWPTVRKVWQKLQDNGDLYLKKYKGLYCAGCEAFITQKDLVGGKCPVHQKEPETVEEENYFFHLSKYGARIKKAIEQGDFKIVPQSRANEIISFIDQGLEDISFSRSKKSLEWGVPVPDDESQTVYVWADALVNYISALDYANEGPLFKKFWPADVQCIGKDISRFHAIYWPAILFSIGLPLPKVLFIHGFINVAGEKMSKSIGNVIDPFELAQKYGTDPVRYFLLREIPPTEDGDFTVEKFEQRYNADLAKGLGNLVARVITLAANLKTQISKLKSTTQNSKLKEAIDKARQDCHRILDDFKFNEALASIWDLISFCDKYIGQEKPWEIENQKSKTCLAGRQVKNEKVINDLLIALYNIAELLKPFLPQTAEKIFQQIKDRKSKPLFPRIDK